MKTLETERLLIRNWRDSDRDLFHEINSHEEVMRFFPFRRDRAGSDAFLDKVRADNARRGHGFAALELKATGETLGFAGLSPDEVSRHDAAPGIEIGWRLARPHWGKGYATESALRLLAFGFDELGLDKIVSFAVPQNTASTAVMRRIGMTPDPSRDFDHPRVPVDMPHLRRHVLYAISRRQWLESTREE